MSDLQPPFRAQPLIILAGGRSRRMGEDKALIDLGGRRMIDLIYDAVRDQSSTIYVSGPTNYDLSISNIPDEYDGPKGPVAALYAGWKTFKENQGVIGFYTVPVDVPDLPNDFTRRLYDSEHSAFAKGTGRTHPTIAWWRLSDLATLFEGKDLTEKMSLHQVASWSKAFPVQWNDQDLFFNINSPNDATEYLTRKKGKNKTD